MLRAAGPASGHTDTGGSSMTHDRDQFAAAPVDLRELLALASDLALQAARIHEEGRRGALSVETKSSPTDLVSQIDKEAERLIVERLRAERPDDALLAEEGSLHERRPAACAGWSTRWTARPTTSTATRPTPRPSPSRSTARRGSAWSSTRAPDASTRRSPGHGARLRRTRPSGRASQTDLSRALVATGFSYDAAQRERQGAVVAAVLGRIRDIRRGGTAALDLCHIAAGEVDAYWELDLSPWDHAAGALIAREAGAAVELAAGGARARAGRGGRAPGAHAGVPRVCCARRAP